jgi:hypothetical protein
MIPYILYSAIILSASLLFYKLLLQKETFFHLNRYVLLICMLLAFVLPLIPVPQQFSFRKITPEKEITIAKTPVENAKTTVIKEEAPQSPTVVEQTQQFINVDLILKCLVYLY